MSGQRVLFLKLWGNNGRFKSLATAACTMLSMTGTFLSREEWHEPEISSTATCWALSFSVRVADRLVGLMPEVLAEEEASCIGDDRLMLAS